MRGANPARETSIPKSRAQDETFAYTLEEILKMVDALPEPAATLIATAGFTGARRSELRGFRWENYRDGELLVTSSIWNGLETAPKSRKSRAPIPIIPWLAKRLELHRARAGNPVSGPLFPNASGKAADTDNIVRRVILPSLNVCESCSKPETEHKRANHKYERSKSLPEWHGWHAFRRGLATNLHRLGVDDITIQAILRHSDVSVTQRCYIKSVPEQSVEAMQKLENALNDTQTTPKQNTSTAPDPVKVM